MSGSFAEEGNVASPTLHSHGPTQAAATRVGQQQPEQGSSNDSFLHSHRNPGQGEEKMLLQMTERQGRRMLTDTMKRNSKRVGVNGAVNGDDA